MDGRKLVAGAAVAFFGPALLLGYMVAAAGTTPVAPVKAVVPACKQIGGLK